MVGILDDVSKAIGLGFRSEGDVVVLLGTNREEIGGSEYLYRKRKIAAGRPPAVDLEGERQLQRALLRLTEMRLLRSAHDCSEGGLACALAESACADGEGAWGVEVEVNEALPPVALFFGESQGRAIVSCEKGRLSDVLGIARSHDVPASVLGTVRARGGTFSMVTPLGFIRARSDEVARRYRDTIPTLMEAR
jgi:phosphoribosylformylglycinamidine synthase